MASVSTRESARQQLINLQSEEARLVFSQQSSRARLARQEAANNRARRNLERTHLLAPFSGRVNRVMVEVGDYLQGNSPVLELIDAAALELEVAVSGDVAAALTLGQQLTVNVDDREVRGCTGGPADRSRFSDPYPSVAHPGARGRVCCPDSWAGWICPCVPEGMRLWCRPPP